MDRPWQAEFVVGPQLAAALIEAQFPALAPARVAPLAVGWDNTALLVNDELVFRFPRRTIAVATLEAEIRVMPGVAGRLPRPVPVPVFHGRPQEEFPWLFTGHRLVPGRPAPSADPGAAARPAFAESLAEFLAALHGIGADEAQRLGAAPDPFGRLDVAARTGRILERLERLAAQGLLDDPAPLRRAVEECPAPAGRPVVLVHGDLYGRHLLVDDGGGLAGVIDWGDVHAGDPAVDLSIAHGFLEPAAREVFRRAYGPVDDAAWLLARFRAVDHATVLLLYACDVNDRALQSEVRSALVNCAR